MCNVRTNVGIQLVASFKAIKTDGLALLHDISAYLIEKSEQCNSVESRKAFASACSQLTNLEEVSYH